MTGINNTRWKNDKPPSIEKFMEKFPDDAACTEHLIKIRWPNGFVCPRCGGKRGWRLKSRPWVYKCAGDGELQDGKRCEHHASVTAGTIMHKTRIPLKCWFIAAYLLATHSNGISALQLQSKIGLGSYKSAWGLLAKLREVLVNPHRKPLAGTVEVDETFIPFRKVKDPVDKIFNQLIVVGGIEKADSGKTGRIRLQHVPDKTKQSLEGFVKENTEPDCTVVTDGNSAYGDLGDRKHEVKNLSRKNSPAAHIELPGIHRVFSNLKRFGMGVYHGFREKHLNAYLNEFVFRWNRRRSFAKNLNTILSFGMGHAPLPYRQIVGDTRAWRRENRQKIYKLTKPDRLEAAKSIAKKEGRDRLDVLLTMPRNYGPYERRKPKRPVHGLPQPA